MMISFYIENSKGKTNCDLNFFFNMISDHDMRLRWWGRTQRTQVEMMKDEDFNDEWQTNR